MISDAHHRPQRPRPLPAWSWASRRRRSSDDGRKGPDLSRAVGPHTGSDTGSRAMLRARLGGDEQEAGTRAYIYCGSRPTGCACPRPIPAHKAWIEVLYCGTVAGEEVVGQRGPCPCDWAEVEAGSRRKVPRSTAGQAAAGYLGSPCWPAARPSLAAWQSVAAVSQCPPVSGLPGARLGGGSESGQLQLQGTLRCRPMYARAPMIAMPTQMPCWTMPSLVGAANM